MSAFYDRMAATTARLVGQFGRTVTLRRTSSVFDPSTGGMVTTTEDLPATGILKNYSANLIDGTVIQIGDRELTLTDAVEPRMTDTVVIDGAAWSIVSIQPMQPAEIVLGYRVQVRR